MKVFNISYGLIHLLGFSTILFLLTFRFFISESIDLNGDSWILIDGVYRVFLNQKPHVDFSTPFGPVLFLAGAIGMKITTPTIAGMNVGFILFSMFIESVAYFTLRRILKPKLMIVFLVLLASMVFTPRMLSGSSLHYAYTGLYNQYGYAILSVLALILFADSRLDVNNNRSFGKGAIVAGFFLLLFFLKFTFGIAAIVLTAIWFSREKKYFLHGFACAVVTLLLILFYWLNFNFEAVARDLKFVISSRVSENPFLSEDFQKSFIKNTLYDNLYILFVLIVGPLTMREQREKIILLALSFACLAYFLSASIMQPPEHILSNILAFCILALANNKPTANSQQPTANSQQHLSKCGYMTLLSISTLWVLKLFMVNMAGPLYDTSNLVANNISYKAGKLFYPSHHRNTPPIRAPSFDINVDRERLVRALVNPALLKWYEDDEKILSVGQNNMFSYYFLTKPLKDNLLYWQHGVTFSRELIKSEPYFSPENIFKNVDIIYLLREYDPTSVDVFENSYSDFLRYNFDIKIKANNWSVLKRRLID